MGKSFCMAFLLFSTLLVQAQRMGLEALRADYPLLMDKFSGELENQRADYYFAVDVSGTMQQYQGTVVPALQDFFRSLQQGDFVSVIKFGGKARNDISSFGTINEEMIRSLSNYVPSLYQIPTNKAERELYYRYTDLEEMLIYLADEMHQIGRNKLKFVFIITDFEHDPTDQKKGKEDWEKLARRIANEQQENYVYVFALQLQDKDKNKDAGRNLPEVRSVFEPAFDFDLQLIQGQSVLSEWFTQKKNRILLDKFTSLIDRKFTELSLTTTPELSIDGNMHLQLDWTGNELFDTLIVDDIQISNPGFRIHTDLPVGIHTGGSRLAAGKVSYHRIAFPYFHVFRDDLTVKAHPDAPYINELSRLGFDPQPISAQAKADKLLFTFFLPCWLTAVILILILFYIGAVTKAIGRNRSNKIKGTFIVSYNGSEIARKTVNRVHKVDIGVGASDLQVNVTGCNWKIEIRYITYSCFVVWKKPEYRIFMKPGSRFKTGNRTYMSHEHPKYAPGGSIVVDDVSIRWKP